jgi:lysophospholipase L1-like esterase
MKKLILVIAISFLLSNPAYTQIRVGGIGDSITLGTGYRLVTCGQTIAGAVGSYRFFLQKFLAKSGVAVDMVGIWGREDGDAQVIGEETRWNDNNWLAQDLYDTDHTGWVAIQTKEMVDFFISVNGAERLFPKPNPIGSALIVHLGTNDKGNPISKTVGHINRLIEYMTEYDQTVKIIICQIVPTLTVETHTDNYNLALKNLVESLSQDNLLTVDLNTPLKNRPELYNDLIHPNKDGYESMAILLYLAMTKHLITVTCGGIL